MLLKARDAAFRSGDIAALRCVLSALSKWIKATKRTNTVKL